MRAVLRHLPRASILLLAIAFAAGCGGDKKNPAGPDGGVTADVIINIVANNAANSFSPNPDTVRVGQTVSWRNQHSQTHTATSDDGTAFNTGNIAPGSTSAPITMNASGTFAYHCTPHPPMVATLVVSP